MYYMYFCCAFVLSNYTSVHPMLQPRNDDVSWTEEDSFRSVIES